MLSNKINLNVNSTAAEPRDQIEIILNRFITAVFICMLAFYPLNFDYQNRFHHFSRKAMRKFLRTLYILFK
jgi:hypothetical protein